MRIDELNFEVADHFHQLNKKFQKMAEVYEEFSENLENMKKLSTLSKGAFDEDELDKLSSSLRFMPSVYHSWSGNAMKFSQYFQTVVTPMNKKWVKDFEEVHEVIDD